MEFLWDGWWTAQNSNSEQVLPLKPGGQILNAATVELLYKNLVEQLIKVNLIFEIYWKSFLVMVQLPLLKQGSWRQLCWNKDRGDIVTALDRAQGVG